MRLPIRSPLGSFLEKQNQIVNFFEAVFYKLRRLSPTNDNVNETMGREFTASLRCVLADTPMRKYIKSIKTHSGYWSR